MFDALDGAPLVERDSTGTGVTVRVPVERAAAQMAGHYPGFPIFPGVLLVDCVRQAAAAALGAPLRLCRIDRARFARPLFEGDELELSLRMTAGGADGEVAVRARGVRSDGQLAAELSLTLGAVVADA
ncbi:hypothetical protein [Streptomyces sp. NPDC017868]|uniref:hypothetical protein n=1 Tax=Streptomyces sp. NPDC017868 TaxID=3365014 RepID=UPI00379CAEA6